MPTSTVLSTEYTVTHIGAVDDNLIMKIKIDRVNNAIPGLSDLQIVDFIRDQLALYTSRPVTIEKIEVVRTTE